MKLQKKWQKYIAIAFGVGLPLFFLNSFMSYKPPSAISPGVRNDNTLLLNHNNLQIKLKIEGLNTNLGYLRVAIYNSSEHFLTLEHTIFKQSYLANVVDMEISLPETTEFALSIYQDANSDGQLNKHFLGFPTEKYGFSNNPTIQFGAPKYEQCRISTKDMPRNKVNEVLVTMK